MESITRKNVLVKAGQIGMGSVIVLQVTLLSAALLANRIHATDIRTVRSGNRLLLTWPADGTNNCYVLSSTNLADTNGWQIETNPVVLVGSNYWVTNTVGSGTRFYRLKSWEILFDGTSTAAFRGYRQTSFPSTAWAITAGKELKTVVGSPSGHIITTNQYDDFELTWEWKTGAGGNSGVLYRVTEYYDEAWKSGPEYQLLDDTAYPSISSQLSGAVYNLIAPTNKVLNAVGQWNQCRLLVQSNHVEHWLNGRRIASYELNSPSFNTLVSASSQFSPYSSQFGKARKGYIAFQNWTPEVWFRNIRVRTLPAK